MTHDAVELRRNRIAGEIDALTEVLGVFEASQSFGPCNIAGIEAAVRRIRELAEMRLRDLGE